MVSAWSSDGQCPEFWWSVSSSKDQHGPGEDSSHQPRGKTHFSADFNSTSCGGSTQPGPADLVLLSSEILPLQSLLSLFLLPKALQRHLSPLSPGCTSWYRLSLTSRACSFCPLLQPLLAACPAGTWNKEMKAANPKRASILAGSVGITQEMQQQRCCEQGGAAWSELCKGRPISDGKGGSGCPKSAGSRIFKHPWRCSAIINVIYRSKWH